MNSNQESNIFDSTSFLAFLGKWKKILLIVSGIAVLSGIIFTSPFFITPKYKATVIMFPTSTNSISKALMSDNYGGKQDILEFGAEEQAEQLLQILNSNKIRARVIQKYNLLEHYDINPESRFKNTLLYKEYENNITFRRTEFMAVEIEVLDKDPQMAADIANDIAALLDSTKNAMQKERAIKGFQIVEAEYKKIKTEVEEMEDSLTQLRKLGVNDYETQAEAYNTQLAIALAQNNMSGAKKLEEKIKTISEYGGAYVSLRDALENDKKHLSDLKTKYEEAKVDAQEELPCKFIVNSAFKAEKKSYPVRWLIVLVSTLSAFLLAVLVLIIIDNIKRHKFTFT
ncbi:MAG TPA: Wzz/FepE/Etk N-terminal domain-containing protein [Bacteroidales bacterium]|nr:Wzz/FepE/Etk N-terminal domain-containing protein [Bacteroidales bacterium]HPS18284.1 Wzz/FepE/Etk N-terminal domain-containing protein [Bacteroidales bacterium]